MLKYFHLLWVKYSHLLPYLLNDKNISCVKFWATDDIFLTAKFSQTTVVSISFHFKCIPGLASIFLAYIVPKTAREIMASSILVTFSPIVVPATYRGWSSASQIFSRTIDVITVPVVPGNM